MENQKYHDLMFRSFPDCVTVKQLQEMLQIKRTQAYELLRNKQIKATKIGKDYKIPKIYVIEFLFREEK